MTYGKLGTFEHVGENRLCEGGPRPLSRPYSACGDAFKYARTKAEEVLRELGMSVANLFQELNYRWPVKKGEEGPNIFLDSCIMTHGTPAETERYVIDLKGKGNVTSAGTARGHLFLRKVTHSKEGHVKTLLVPTKVIELPYPLSDNMAYRPEDVSEETGFPEKFAPPSEGSFRAHFREGLNNLVLSRDCSLTTVDALETGRLWDGSWG